MKKGLFTWLRLELDVVYAFNRPRTTQHVDKP